MHQRRLEAGKPKSPQKRLRKTISSISTSKPTLRSNTLQRKRRPRVLSQLNRTQHSSFSTTAPCTDSAPNLPFHTKTDLYGATRTHYISDLQHLPAGSHVSLSGWVDRIRPMGQLFFLVLRDHTGTIQATLEQGELDQHHEVFQTMNLELQPESTTSTTANSVHKEVDMSTVSFDAYSTGIALGPEYVISIKGVLQDRPADMMKGSQTMGSKEVRIRSLRQLNTSKPIPISLHDQHNEMSNEDTRMKYRYLDLRRDSNQYILRLRSQLTMAARQAMYYLGFNEIETPYLIKSTPEGAREFLVPSRSRGKFYALPQSPQQFKQLLMCSGFDKYFQIARCFRDESGRQDRQPEFTQLDLELAFTTPDHVMHSVETMVNAMHLQTYGVPMKTLKKIRYIDAMNRFGSDKPDLRFSSELQDITSIFVNSMLQPTVIGDSAQKTKKRYILRTSGKIEVSLADSPTKPPASPPSAESPSPTDEVAAELTKQEFLQQISATNTDDETIQQLLRIYPPFLAAQNELETSSNFGHFTKITKTDSNISRSSQPDANADHEIALKVPTPTSTDPTAHTIKPLARHPFPVVKMIVARDLNDVLTKSNKNNKQIMEKILRDCREGSNGLQPTIISCSKWKIKTSLKILNQQHVQQELISKYNLKSNDLLFILAGDWENVCNGLGKIRLNLKSLLKAGNEELLPAIIEGERLTPPKPLSELSQTDQSGLNMNPYTRFTDYLIEDSWKQQNSTQFANNQVHHHPRKPLNPTGQIPTFHWVVDFPLFEPVIPASVYSRDINNNNNNNNNNQDSITIENVKNNKISINAMHHPFTAPHPEDMAEFHAITAKFDSTVEKDAKGEPIYTTSDALHGSVDKSHSNAIPRTKIDPVTNYPLDLLTVSQQLGQIRALHYDLVSNGLEVGGGSIRIHNPNIQRSVFNLLQVPHGKFSHLLDALEFGAPPHGGFAAGLDRLVAIFGSNAMSHHSNSNNGDPLKLKDVIAFPKSSTGNDLLLGTPNEQTKQQLDEYSIQIKEIIQPPQ